MDLSSNTAVITGSSGGIGEEFAVQLAQRGVNLVLVARRADKLEELRRTLLERHPDIVIDVITADLATPGSGAQLATKVRDLGRPIDILVNNAGVGLHAKFVGQDLTARFLPSMTAAGHGVVINVASTAGFQPTPGMAVYGATKAFVLSFSEALWQECKGTECGCWRCVPARRRRSSSREPARSSSPMAGRRPSRWSTPPWLRSTSPLRQSFPAGETPYCRLDTGSSPAE